MAVLELGETKLLGFEEREVAEVAFWCVSAWLQVRPVDFGVSSVNIVFHDAKTMNIMNWISTKSASAVQGFIQHHLNSWHHAERSTDICKRVKFRAPGTRSAFVAQMSMGEIEGEPGEGDPRKMRLDLKGVVFR